MEVIHFAGSVNKKTLNQEGTKGVLDVLKIILNSRVSYFKYVQVCMCVCVCVCVYSEIAHTATKIKSTLLVGVF